MIYQPTFCNHPFNCSLWTNAKPKLTKAVFLIFPSYLSPKHGPLDCSRKGILNPEVSDTSQHYYQSIWTWTGRLHQDQRKKLVLVYYHTTLSPNTLLIPDIWTWFALILMKEIHIFWIWLPCFCLLTGYERCRGRNEGGRVGARIHKGMEFRDSSTLSWILLQPSQ